MDFKGSFCGCMWFNLVDARTKLPEVVLMETITMTKTVQALRNIFSHWGLKSRVLTKPRQDPPRLRQAPSRYETLPTTSNYVFVKRTDCRILN